MNYLDWQLQAQLEIELESITNNHYNWPETANYYYLIRITIKITTSLLYLCMNVCVFVY